MQSSETTQKIKSCTFWELTPEERAEVIATAPIQDVWELNMERLKDGYWQFSIPELKTINELMVGGTEKIMDWHYTNQSGLIPDECSRMTVRVSSSPMDVNHAVLHKEADDIAMANAATYTDKTSSFTGWICGWIAVPFGCAPPIIYASVEPTA